MELVTLNIEFGTLCAENWVARVGVLWFYQDFSSSEIPFNCMLLLCKKWLKAIILAISFFNTWRWNTAFNDSQKNVCLLLYIAQCTWLQSNSLISWFSVTTPKPS